MTSTPRRPRVAAGTIAGALLFLGATQAALAATVQVQVLLDLDANAATGCTIVTTAGTFSGAEQVLTTTIDTTANMVTAVSRQVCTGGVLGAPIPVNSPYSPPWPIGPGAGAGGSTLIETYVRLSDIPFTGTALRAGFVTTDQIGQQDGIFSAALVFPAGAPAIPTLSQWGLIALAGLLSITALVVIRRAGAGTALMVLLAVLLAGGVAFAAITLTGNPADWAGVPPLATKAAGVNPTRAEIYAVYAVGDGVSLFFRIDAKLCPVITVSPNTLPAGSTSAAYPTTNFSQVGGTPPITWSETGALPSGMTFTGAGVLSGSPTQIGTFPMTFTATDANLCAGSQAITLTINACPTITVTPNTLAPGTGNAAYGPVTFTATGGTGSTTWSNTGALPTGMSFSAGGVLSGTPTQTGSFPVTFIATDSLNCTGSQPITLLINCQAITVNNPATTTGTANAAFNQTFTQLGAIGTATFTTASALPAGLSLSTGGVLSGTPTQTGSFPITVTVTDANGCTGTGGTYTLVINCQTITVTNPPTSTGTVNTPFSQTFTQSNAIGATTFTTASALPTGLTLATNGTLSGTPQQTGNFPIVVTVTDGNGCTGTSSTYTLVIGCQTITVSNPAISTGTVNTPFSQTFTQVGAIGGATFTTASTLPTGLTLATNGTLSGTPQQSGNFPIVVTVTDGNGCTGNSPTYTLVISCQAMSVGPATVPQGTVNVLYPTVTFSQSGGIGTVNFSETGALPTGINFTGGVSGTLSGTPTQSGSFPITVTATDSNGCFASHDYLVVVVCAGTSITLSPSSLPTVTVNTAFPSTTFTASGGVGPYMFSKSGALPSGMSFVTDTLSGTPTQTGVFPITISAIDTVGGCVGSQDYVVTVTCAGVTITVSPASLAAGAPGTPYAPVTFTASGGTSPYTFMEVGQLPAGMSFSIDTLSGTPTQAGTFPITVTATDSAGCSGTTSYSLSIVCQAITVTNPGVTAGTVDAPFSQTFTQTGAVGTATFTTVSALPPGFTLSSAGVLSGTPGAPGSFPIVVKVTDSNGCTGTGATYTLVISCQTITVTNPVVTTGTVDAAFSQTFTQSGVGTHTPAVFTLNSGSLPSGMTLSAGGVLSGSPGAPGSFPITVKVTDANGCTGISPTYTLVVACQTITVTVPPVSTAVFNTALSPAASYTFTQAGVGTHTPANFTTASTLPAGVSLTTAGVLTGTPTVTGTFPIVVTVTDANGCTGTSATYNLAVAPVAVADSYSGLVDNTQFVVTGGSTGSPATPFVAGAFASRLTVNDLPSGGVTLTTGSFATTAGGSVTIAADGTFIYTPKANPTLAATTSDSFTYTISSNTGGTGTPTTATGTASLTLLLRVWYVKNDAGAGLGQSQSPFNTLAAAGGASTVNDFIYVYFGNGTSSGQNAGIALKNGQVLAGEGVSFTVNGNLLRGAGSSPLITNGGGNVVTLANNNFIQGLTLNGAANALVFGGGGVAGTTILNTVFMTPSGTANGVSLTSQAAGHTFNYNSGSIVSSSSGAAVLLSGAGGAGPASFAINISSSSGMPVSIANRTAQIVAFNGSVSSTGQGVSLTTNPGSTINFTGGLSLSTGANAAFTSTGGGTVTATQNNTSIVNTLSTTTGTALNVANTTIGAAGLTFRSITAGTGAGSAGDGIILDTTGSSGGLTVTGNGGAGTGGTIQHKTGADGSTAGGIGIYLNSTSSVSLTRMQLNDFANFAIRGTSVSGFSLTSSAINGVNGDNDTFNEGSISFDELTGSATMTSDNISGGWEDNLRLLNTTGSLNRLTLSNCTIGANSASFGNAGLNMQVQGAGTMNVTVDSCAFTGSRSHFVQYLLNGNSTPAGDFVFTNNTITQSMASIAGAGGVYVSGSANASPAFTFNIQNNIIHSGTQTITGHDINVSHLFGGTYNGTIDSNTIGSAGVAGSGSSQGSGIAIIHVGGGTYTVHVTNNTVRRYNDRGIFLQVGDNTTGGNGTVNLTVTGNTVAEPDSFALHGLHLNIGTTAGDAMFVCASIGGAGALTNTLTGSGVVANGGFDIRSQQRFNTTIRLPGYGGANNDNAAVVTFLSGRNTLATSSVSQNVAGGGGGYVGGAACP